MTANEPPNPYTAPAAALSDGTAGVVPSPPAAQKPPRRAAVVASLVGFPPGAGFYLLGRRRLFAGWTTAGVVAVGLMIGTGRAPLPKVCVIAIAAAIAIRVATVVATIIARPGSTPVKHAGRWALVLLLAGMGASAAIKQSLIEAFQMPSGSMAPTLLIGDHIFVRKGQSGVTRGDPIVFKFPADRSTDYIKRVIAIGGDTVEVREGVVSINGVALEQTPLEGACPAPDRGQLGVGEQIACKLVRETNNGRSYTIMFEEGRAAQDHPRTIIPPGQLFVLGDNRDNSYDSRRWGTVPMDDVKGVATVIWWSRDGGPIRWSRVGHGVE